MWNWPRVLFALLVMIVLGLLVLIAFTGTAPPLAIAAVGVLATALAIAAFVQLIRRR